MAVAWTIQGEVGKAWDASTLTFEQRKIENARFEFKSLDVDTFTFRISAQTIASETLPDYTQKIVIYRDGVRFFTGHVTNRQVQIDSGSQICDVTVSGPWWWMERITFTATNTDATGATAERATLAFGGNAGQSLQLSIQQAIDRSVDLGVPIAKTSVTSSVATMTTFPRITLNQSTCSQVISELVRCCADAMVYFDYSQATPSIQVTRRKASLPVGSAATITFNASTDPITSIDLNPMIELEVSKVDLPYLDRDTLGRYRFQNQSHGTASSPLPKRQIITVSGPELDTFLPVDLFDSFVCGSTTSAREALLFKDSQISSFASKYGSSPIGTSWPAALNGPTTISYWLNGKGGTITSYQVPAATFTPSASKFIITNKIIPDWALDQFGIYETKISGGLHGAIAPYPKTQYSDLGVDFHAIFGDLWWTTGSGSSTTVFAGRLIDREITLFAVPESQEIKTSTTGTVLAQPNLYTLILDSNADPVDNIYVGASIFFSYSYNGKDYTTNGYISQYNGNTRTVIISGNPSGRSGAAGKSYTINRGVNYRASDYAFISPPTGLAEFLKECQDFVPYQGTVQLTQEDVGANRYTGKKMRISNFMPEYAAMDALVKSESLVVETGETTITIGQPDRFDYRTLVDRIRKTSQDNIYYTVS